MDSAPRNTRIIPARAGFTALPVGAHTHQWDHPRSRGVYRPGYLPDPVRRGSSPLARGLRLKSVFGTPRARIIPARAGFTHHDYSVSQESADHPRSRGVYRAMSSRMTSRAGSSPLARGLHVVFITHPKLRQDHPRSRGVYVPFGLGWCLGLGSSPLARGLRACLWPPC